MKEKLSQSLQMLSESVEELSRNLLLYKDRQAKKVDEKIEFFQNSNDKKQAEISNLQRLLAIEQSKNNQAVREIKSLIVSLKNKLGGF